MTNLPKSIKVTGIPYTVIEDETNQYDFGCNSSEQTITITKEAAPARKRQFLFYEIALLLMEAAGFNQKAQDRYFKQIGAVLNRFVMDNDTDFVKGIRSFPSTIWINGIPYTMDFTKDEVLEVRNLGGEIRFKELDIRISTELAPEIKRYVVIHECTHGILFEAFAGNYHENEPLVEALAWQMYYFLCDNSFNNLKPEGEKEL